MSSSRKNTSTCGSFINRAVVAGFNFKFSIDYGLKEDIGTFYKQNLFISNIFLLLDRFHQVP